MPEAEAEKDCSDVDDASDRLVFLDREDGQETKASEPTAAPLDGPEYSTSLEREASVGTPLEWNCTEASSFDTNVLGSPHEAVDASKKAVEPDDVQDPSAFQSWLPDGSASLSKFSSTAEMLASQAAGLFSKSGESKPQGPETANPGDAAGMADDPDAHDASAEPSLPKDGAPSTQCSERWFPDSSSASLAKLTHAAETLATQAAGLFSKSDTSEHALTGAAAKPDVEASRAGPDEPAVQPAAATDDSKETWLGAALANITQAAGSLASHTKGLFASKEDGSAQYSSWLPDGSASLSKFSSTAEMLASQAAGLFSKSGESKPQGPETANPGDAAGMADDPDAHDASAEPSLPKDGAPSTQCSERWFPDSSSASLAKLTHAAETLATQAAGLFSKSDTSEHALTGAAAKPDVEASRAGPDEPAAPAPVSQETLAASASGGDPAEMASASEQLPGNPETQNGEATAQQDVEDSMKQTTSWVPDGSAASLSRWTAAAGTVATQAMGLFTTTARAASAEGEVGETSQSCADDTSTSVGSSFSKIKTAAESIASQASGLFVQSKSQEDASAPSAGRSLADLSGALSQLASQTTGLLSPLSPRWTQADGGDPVTNEVGAAEAEGEGPPKSPWTSESSEVQAELQRRRCATGPRTSYECWRCGAEIVAELDAVEAHEELLKVRAWQLQTTGMSEEICSRPMQQLLDAADLLAPQPLPGDLIGMEPGSDPAESSAAEGPPSCDEQQTSSQSSWTRRGVSALVDLKQSVQATSSSVARKACEAAGYGGAALTPELDPLQVYCRIETTVEAVVLLVLEPVLKGLPSLGVPSARVEARRAVGEHGTAAAAVAALLAKAEKDDGECGMSQRVLRKVSELLVMRFLPVVGAGAFLSYTIYVRLRLAALVAEMFGHDAEDPDVQGLLFFCVLPGGNEPEEAPSVSDPGTPDSADDAFAGPAAGASVAGKTPSTAVRAAKGLGHGLARQVVQRSTGWRSAADLYDLAAAICSERTATDGEDAEGPLVATVRRAALLFEPCRASESGHPALLGLLGLGAAAPTLLAVAFQLLQLSSPLLGGLAVPLLLAVLAILVAVVVVLRWQLLDAFSEQPELVTSSVFLVQALLPLFSAFAATRLLVEGLLRKPMAGSGTEEGGGILFLLLGGWACLRLWQRMQAPEGSETARGQATLEQRAVLVVVLALGATDFLGLEGWALHGLPSFGALRSRHWLLGLLQAQALECQLYLSTLLRNRQVLLRLLGATRMMSLCVTLFLAGITASVGFLVSRSEFLRFVDGLAPPPRLTAVCLALRRESGACAMLLGASAGLLWQLPPGLAFITKTGGIVLGAAAGGFVWATYEEYREVLEEPSGGRWLLLLPETSENAKVQALRVWSKLKLGLTEAAVERSATFLGRGMLDSMLNRLGCWWCSVGAVEIAEKVVEARSLLARMPQPNPPHHKLNQKLQNPDFQQPVKSVGKSFSLPCVGPALNSFSSMHGQNPKQALRPWTGSSKGFSLAYGFFVYLATYP
ncbi:unnamed protein product [Symbiodinium sp. CCMP2592]|nr:unnamed protein product [Symbiodinium sp. CCMP2592]